jgi:thiol-disulfide isomerase/thioredoxin
LRDPGKKALTRQQACGNSYIHIISAGGPMKSTSPINHAIAVVFAAFALMLCATSGTGIAADLASSANIFLYPQPLPVSDMVLKTSSGKDVSLRDFKGKVVLLHFWSIQCPACKLEEPLLDNLKKSFGPAGLEILAVNLVDPPQAIMSHVAANKPPFPVLFDGGKGFSLKVVSISGKHTAFVVNPTQEAILEVPGFPTTYIVDCRGSAVAYSVGAARWDNTAAVGLIKGLISDRKSCPAPTS